MRIKNEMNATIKTNISYLILSVQFSNSKLFISLEMKMSVCTVFFLVFVIVVRAAPHSAPNHIVEAVKKTIDNQFEILENWTKDRGFTS
jgi:hypothetical protein